MQERVLRCGIVQTKVKARPREATLAWALGAVEECARAGCRLVCLPEAFATSLSLPELKRLAEPIPGDTSAALCRVAREAGTYIVAGIAERVEGGVFSSAVLIDDS